MHLRIFPIALFGAGFGFALFGTLFHVTELLQESVMQLLMKAAAFVIATVSVWASLQAPPKSSYFLGWAVIVCLLACAWTLCVLQAVTAPQWAFKTLIYAFIAAEAMLAGGALHALTASKNMRW